MEDYQFERIIGNFVKDYDSAHRIFKPTLIKFNGKWEARYGDILGIGSSPEGAVEDFNRKYHEKIIL